MKTSDLEIHSYHKLDKILYKLCRLVVEGQKSDKEKFGMVAAAVIDPDNNVVMGINLPADNDQRQHAERVAIDRYKEQHGDIPEGSIVVTTLSPCSEHMDERYGESCTDLLNNEGIKKVYAGYMDPTQEEEQRQFNIMETANASIRELCKGFADTFLELNEAWSAKYKRSINCSNPKGFSQRAHCQGRKKHNENFADGRNPQDKGDSKRHGVPTKASVSSLRKFAKSHSGRAAQLAHWMANMKSGKKKK